MAHVFRFFRSVSDEMVSGSDVTLGADDAARIAKVLRLGPGDSVEVADGTGRVFAATVADPRVGRVTVGAELARPPDLAPIRVLLAQSGPRADDAVEKLVELGVCEIAPLVAAGRRRDARRDRWERVAKGAAEQAKLVRIPVIGAPIAFADALGSEAIVCSHEQADTRLDAALGRCGRPVTLLIGPEAGFADNELAAARAAGRPIVMLGQTVLRTETAAIVAAALVRDRLRADSLPE